jgi:hypothetical protein
MAASIPSANANHIASKKAGRGQVLWYLEYLTSTCMHALGMSCVSSVVINRGGGLSAAHSGEYIFLPRIKTTLHPRKKEREKLL